MGISRFYYYYKPAQSRIDPEVRTLKTRLDYGFFFRYKPTGLVIITAADTAVGGGVGMSSGRSHPYLILLRLSMEPMGPLIPTAPLRCQCDCRADFPTDTYDVSVDLRGLRGSYD